MTALQFESAAPSLTASDVERFSRQIMVEGIGAAGMARIRGSRVTCVGAGGLGSTITLYLAAAGVGTLTVIDFDDVEVSNLHRQVIHTTANVGRPKVESAREACLAVFPAAHVVAVPEALGPHNARRLLEGSDVIVDGSDNVAARYLINDAAMALGVPLVSGSAMRWDGQLSVYGFQNGPCYRCVFPEPPPAAAVGSCNDTGVVGPVPGLIGCMQALETLKLLAGAGDVLSGRLFLFDGLRFTARVVKLRPKQPACTACSSSQRETTGGSLLQARPEYVPESCATGAAFSHTLLPEKGVCVNVTAFAAAMHASQGASRCVCFDVRASIQFDMAHLKSSTSLPLSELELWVSQGTFKANWEPQLRAAIAAAWVSETIPVGHKRMAHPSESAEKEVEPAPYTVFFICRRGVASARATRLVLDALNAAEKRSPEQNCAVTAWTMAGAEGRPLTYTVRNVDGGLNAFHRAVDPSFPFY